MNHRYYYALAGGVKVEILPAPLDYVKRLRSYNASPTVPVYYAMDGDEPVFVPEPLDPQKISIEWLS